MTNTNYDEIYSCFLDNCMTEVNNLPSTDEGRYVMIHNACRHYNNVMDSQYKIQYNDTTESLDKKLADDELLILAYCLKLIYYKNDLSSFTSTWSMYQKELGFKDYKYQLDGKQYNVEFTKHEICELITNYVGSHIME